jgi:hypothetical protein
MPRRYGPGHFTEDPYSLLVSPHGIPVDDLVAVLQKEIRRSRIDNAVLAAYEMFTTSADVAEHLWRRLRLIAVEDVGMGLPLGPVLIDVLHRNFNATPGGEWMMACHAVRLLAAAPKDRTSSEHADWVAAKVALGEALVEVPDYAHCVHTRAGQELGRGLMQWWDTAATKRRTGPRLVEAGQELARVAYWRPVSWRGPGGSTWQNGPWYLPVQSGARAGLLVCAVALPPVPGEGDEAANHFGRQPRSARDVPERRVLILGRSDIRRADLGFPACQYPPARTRGPAEPVLDHAEGAGGDVLAVLELAQRPLGHPGRLGQGPPVPHA